MKTTLIDITMAKNNFSQVEQAIVRLKENVAEEMENTLKSQKGFAEETVEKNARVKIGSRAEVGALGEKPDQQSLYDSFGSYVSKDITSDGIAAKLVVGSDAPHAVALNDGTEDLGGYKIFPKNATSLQFEGKPSDSYSEEANSIYSVDDGAGEMGGDIVTMESGNPVEHPGVSAARYLETSLPTIESTIDRQLDTNIRKAILESGFKPSLK